MSKFNINDKIVCTNNVLYDTRQLTVGKVYTVLDTIMDGVLIIDDSGDRVYFYESRFDHAPQDNVVQLGTKYDGNKAPMYLLPFEPLQEVAQVFEFGKQKYGEFNYLQGIPVTRLLSACLRHVMAHLWVETNDKETGRSHLAHAMCCLLMAMQMQITKAEMDDRLVNRKGVGNE